MSNNYEAVHFTRTHFSIKLGAYQLLRRIQFNQKDTTTLELLRPLQQKYQNKSRFFLAWEKSVFLCRNLLSVQNLRFVGAPPYQS